MLIGITKNIHHIFSSDNSIGFVSLLGNKQCDNAATQISFLENVGQFFLKFNLTFAKVLIGKW